MKFGLDTKLDLTARDLIYILGILGAGILAYSQLATEAQLTESKASLQQQVDEQKERNAKLDTAIQLLQQADGNHDKHLEAFTRALEQLREE
jgi:cell division protein FtsB